MSSFDIIKSFEDPIAGQKIYGSEIKDAACPLVFRWGLGSNGLLYCSGLQTWIQHKQCWRAIDSYHIADAIDLDVICRMHKEFGHLRAFL